MYESEGGDYLASIKEVAQKARAAATYIVNFRANAAGASVGNNKIGRAHV